MISALVLPRSISGFLIRLTLLAACAIWGAYNLLPNLADNLSYLLPARPVENKNHAVERRMSEGNQRDVVNTRECLNKNGSALTIQNLDTGRWAEVCLFFDLDRQEDVFGIRVCETTNNCWIEEVTTLVKNKLARLPQIVKYLENRGYTEILYQNSEWLWGIVENPVSVYNVLYGTSQEIVK